MLRFLHHHIGYRIKKRTFVVLAIALSVTFLVAAILALSAVWIAGPADVLRIEITEPEGRERVLGAGLDLASLPGSNFLVDPSFEPVTFRETLSVYEGDNQTLTVSEYQVDPVIAADGFYDGATVRVLSPGPDGLAVKKNDQVASYRVNRVGRFQAVQLPADVPAGRPIYDFADGHQTTLAVGAEGLILRAVAQGAPEVVPSGVASDLTGICTSPDGFLASSSAGDLIFSPDGQTWVSWPVPEPKPLHDVAALDEALYVAVGDQGVILAGGPAQLTEVPSPVTSDLIEVAASDKILLALAADGTVIRSTTGLFWEIVQRPTSLHETWRSLTCLNGTFVLAGDNGLVAFSEDGRQFTPAPTRAAGNIRDVVLLNANQLIVLDDSARFQYSNDGGQTWSDSSLDTGLQSQRLALLGDRHVVSADQDGRLGLAPLVIEIELENPLVSGTFNAGDLLYLEKMFNEMPLTVTPSTDRAEPEFSQSWEVFGPGSAERTALSVPDEGGRAALHLVLPGSNDPEGHQILSQRVDPKQFSQATRSDIYQVELWMRQEAIPDAAVKIWISGSFDSIGTTIDHVGSTWKRYTHTFILPSSLVAQSPEVRLNIGYAGSGELWLDRVHFSRADQPVHGLRNDLTEAVTRIKPAMIRLTGLPLGSTQLPSDQWSLPPGNEVPVYEQGRWSYPASQSLSSTLELARAGQSDPWLVLDSSFSETELMHLLEYIAGPVSSPYGRLRLDQGQILPWSDQFDHLYLEIRDAQNQFSEDFMRADFVDWLIVTASQSPYYNELKNQLVFIDGMAYSDGVWRSSADYHVSSLQGNYISAGQDGIAAAILAYYDRMPRNPSQARQGFRELISPLDLIAEGQEKPELADLLTLNLQELGTSAAQCNLAWPGQPGSTALNLKRRELTATLAAETANSVVLKTFRAESDLQAFAYRRDEQTLIILANTGSQPLSARLTGLIDTRGQFLQSYDANGQLLRERQLRRNQELLTVLPGGVVVLKKSP